MAQIIMCDPHGMAHPADWLITRMADGEVQAYCNVAFLEFVTMAASSAADDEADETDAQAADRLQAAGQLSPEDEAELDAAAIEARIGGGDTIDRDDRDDDGRAEGDAAPPQTAIEATDDAIREVPWPDPNAAEIAAVPALGQVIDGSYGTPPVTTLPEAKNVTPEHVVRRGRSAKARKARAVAIEHSGKRPDVDWAAKGPDDDEDDDGEDAAQEGEPSA